MPIRSENAIKIIVQNTKSNAFAKMMAIGKSGSVGVPIEISLYRQLNLINACSSIDCSLSQKNVLADQIGEYRYDVTSPDGVFSNNVFVNGF